MLKCLSRKEHCRMSRYFNTFLFNSNCGIGTPNVVRMPAVWFDVWLKTFFSLKDRRRQICSSYELIFFPLCLFICSELPTFVKMFQRAFQPIPFSAFCNCYSILKMYKIYCNKISDDFQEKMFESSRYIGIVQYKLHSVYLQKDWKQRTFCK